MQLDTATNLSDTHNPHDYTITVWSETGHRDIFFKVTGLDAYTAYDICKDGIIKIGND